MSDIALVWDSETGAADFAFGEADTNDLLTDAGLETACMLSLFTDRRAEPGDVLPEGETDRRGWWADGLGEILDDKIGSRLWLLSRAKESPETRARAEEYAREALQWLIDDRVADRIELEVSFPQKGAIGIGVSIYRPAGDTVRFKYHSVWAAQES